MKEASYAPPLTRNSSSFYVSGSKWKRRPSFSHSWLEVDLSQFPGISDQSSTTFESMFLPVHILSIFLTYCLRKPGPLLRCIWSLRSGSPERNTVTHTVAIVYNPESCTGAELLRTQGRIITGPRALEFFSHGV